MNDLIRIITNIKDNQKVQLERDVYQINQEDCFLINGLYCTNSSSLKNNPKGEKHSLFFIENKKDVVIDGSGATIVLHGPITPFVFNSCHNIEIKNLNIIRANPTTLEFTAKEIALGEAIINIHKDNLYLIEDNNLFWYEENGEHIYCKHSLNEEDTITMMYLNDCLTYSPFRSKTTRFPSLPPIKSVKELSPGVVKLVFEDESLLPKKAVFQMRHTMRNEIGGLFVNSEQIAFNDINVNFTGDMGYIYQCSKDIIINHFNIIPSEGRIISSQADFFHFSNCAGKIVVENCDCSGAQDDIINVHGIYLQIVEINKEERSIVVKFPHPETFGFDVFFPGDKIGFVKHDTLEVFNQNIVKNTAKIDLFTQKLYLSQAIPDVNLGKDVIDNLSKKPTVIIRGNKFKNIATRAILSTTNKDVKIYNNVFENITMPILYVSNDCNNWFESGSSGKISFHHNVIIDSLDNNDKQKVVVQYEPVVLNEQYKGYVHESLTFKKNQFISKHSLTPVIRSKYLKKLSIANNVSKKDFIIK